MGFILAADNAALNYLQTLRSPAFDSFFALLTRFGDFGALWLAVGALCMLFPRARRCGVSVLASLAVCVLVCDALIKPAVARVRPFIANGAMALIDAPFGYSFPSGHTATAFASASAIFAFNRRAGAAAFAMAAAIGFSRVYLYVHYPSDVLAGAALGIIIGTAAGFAAKH